MAADAGVAEQICTTRISTPFSTSLSRNSARAHHPLLRRQRRQSCEESGKPLAIVTPAKGYTRCS
jgi:hypothetical protein